MAPLWRLGSDVLSSEGGHAEAIQRLLQGLDRDVLATQVLADVLPDTVLTISWSSAVSDSIRRRHPRLVVCMVSDPGGEGRETAAALAGAADAVQVMEDAEALQAMPAEAVAVGADAVTSRHVVNKVGTRALAQAAAASGIPCYVVAGDTKFVAEDLPIAGPFEPTPLELFTAIAAPGKLCSPAQARELARRHPLHPTLVESLDDLRHRPGHGS